MIHCSNFDLCTIGKKQKLPPHLKIMLHCLRLGVQEKQQGSLDRLPVDKGRFGYFVEEKLKKERKLFLQAIIFAILHTSLFTGFVKKIISFR